MRFNWVFLVVSISACTSTSPSQINPSPSFIGPNGGTAYLMRCVWSDAAWGVAPCYKRAREVCPSGYTIFDSIDDSNNGTSFHFIAYECKK
jgi:hypothetical protein